MDGSTHINAAFQLPPWVWILALVWPHCPSLWAAASPIESPAPCPKLGCCCHRESCCCLSRSDSFLQRQRDKIQRQMLCACLSHPHRIKMIQQKTDFKKLLFPFLSKNATHSAVPTFMFSLFIYCIFLCFDLLASQNTVDLKVFSSPFFLDILRPPMITCLIMTMIISLNIIDDIITKQNSNIFYILLPIISSMWGVSSILIDEICAAL